MLVLADLKDLTENEVKRHIADNYAGKESGFDGRDPTRKEIDDLFHVLENYDVIVAYESVGNWGCDSSSWFLFKEKTTGEYFETSGSHCSCYGFEGQFDLASAPVEYLKSDKFYLGCGGYDDDSEGHQESVKLFLQTL